MNEEPKQLTWRTYRRQSIADTFRQPCQMPKDLRIKLKGIVLHGQNLDYHFAETKPYRSLHEYKYNIQTMLGDYTRKAYLEPVQLPL